MTPEQIETAQALVACKGWRWLPRMAAVDPHDAGWSATLLPDGLWICTTPGNSEVFDGTPFAGPPPVRRIGPAPVMTGFVPDLSDPLTSLGVLHVVRLAYCDESARVTQDFGSWLVLVTCANRATGGRRRMSLPVAPTEIEALLAALQAAP